MQSRSLLRTWLVVALGALALMVAGCGDDDDDGGNGAGPSGAGEPITAANAAVVQAQVQNTIGAAIGKGPGKHDGAVSGTVEIELSTGKLAQIDISTIGGMQSIRYSIKFKNYSDDGEVWVDGTVNYTLDGSNLSYTIDLEISGAYEGEVEGQVSVSGGVVSGYWNVNGERISF